MINVVAVLLVVLCPIGPWAMVVVWRALRRSPDVYELRSQLARFGLSSLQAIVLAVIAIIYLARLPLPRGTSLVLLLGVLLLVSGPPTLFLIDYYRRR